MVCLLLTSACFASSPDEIKNTENKAAQGDALCEGMERDIAKVMEWYEKEAERGGCKSSIQSWIHV